MKKLTLLASLVLTLVTSLAGCSRPLSSGEAFGLGVLPMEDDYRPASQIKNKTDKSPDVVGPPQVVYRIDKDRYIGMENYTGCNYGDLYYHNDAKKIKTLLTPVSEGVFNFKGKIAWLADNDTMMALPLVSRGPCSERGCTSNLRSSADGGKTFTNISFSQHSAYPVESSEKYLVVVTNDAIYLKDKMGSDEYLNTIKYVPDENGVLYDSWLRQYDADTNNELVKMGIPREVLNDKNPFNLNYDLLISKYHYIEAQADALVAKIDEITRQLGKKPRDNGPDATSSPAGDSSFHCDLSLVPNNITH